MTNWVRPQSVNFPSVWATFKGKNTVSGRRREYWIQDLTEEYEDEVLHHMITGFLKQETILTYSRIADDPASIEGLRTLWKKFFEYKVTIICLTKDDDDVTHLVGCNVLYVSQTNDPKKLPDGKALSMVVDAIDRIYATVDLFAELNVDTYLNAFGLYVVPEYRGEGIGAEILKARRQLSLALGLKVSVTIFTTIGGQKTADKAGFKDIIVFPYKDLKKFNSFYESSGIIENANTPSMIVKYARYND